MNEFENPTVPTAPTVPIGSLITEFIELKQAKEQLTASLKATNAALDIATGYLSTGLADLGIKSVKSERYKVLITTSPKTYVSVSKANMNALIEWLHEIDRDNLVETSSAVGNAALKSLVKQIQTAEEHEEFGEITVPDFINVFTKAGLSVRKSS